MAFFEHSSNFYTPYKYLGDSTINKQRIAVKAFKLAAKNKKSIAFLLIVKK